MFTQQEGPSDAQAVCFSRVNSVTEIEGEKTQQFQTRMLIMNLKKENDGVWRVNSITTHQSLETLPINNVDFF